MQAEDADPAPFEVLRSRFSVLVLGWSGLRGNNEFKSEQRATHARPTPPDLYGWDGAERMNVSRKFILRLVLPRDADEPRTRTENRERRTSNSALSPRT